MKKINIFLVFFLIFFFAKNAAASFSFAVYGDSRSGHDYHQAVVNQITVKNPDFVLHTGDFVGSGGQTIDWTQFQNIAAPLLSKTPPSGLLRSFFPAIGNHDLPLANYFSVFGMSDYYYSFDYQNFHFISLNTEQEYVIGSEQYNWLASDLDNTQNKNIIVFFHRPPYSSGPHGSNQTIINNLVPQFEEHKVRFVFSGHDHIYERSYPVYQNAIDNKNGVIYIISGAGGAELYNITLGNWWTAKAESLYHFTYFQITGNKFYGTTIDKDGNIVENFEIISSDIENPIVLINPGAQSINSREALLSFSASEIPYQMMISENLDFSGAVWETFAATKLYTLSEGDGMKTIYVKFRDSSENETETASDGIILAVNKAKFVTQSADAAKDEILIETKNKNYSIADFDLNFKKFPKKLQRKKYYLQVQKFAKYPLKFAKAKNSAIKKYWKVDTNLHKYKPKTKKNKFRINLAFKYTNKEWKVLKSRGLKESDLVLKYYQPQTGNWKKLTAKHNLKKNTFAITISDFDLKNNLFVIARK